MGAQQAFQWAVSYPTFMDRIVATSGTAKTYGHGIVRLESEIAAISADQTFNGGDYTTEPKKGIEAFSLVWTAWLFSQEWWRRELWREDDPKLTTLAQVIASYRDNFIPNADANNLILQMRTWESNDVGHTPGFHDNVEAALRSIRVPSSTCPPPPTSTFPSKTLATRRSSSRTARSLPIPSLWGHPAGAGASPADGIFLNQHIAAFLKQ